MMALVPCEWLIRLCFEGAVGGLSFAAQSTVLILTGFLVARAFRRRGAAAQSLALRVTLLAVAVSPLVWWSVRTAGMETFSVPLPLARGTSLEVAGSAQGGPLGHSGPQGDGGRAGSDLASGPGTSPTGGTQGRAAPGADSARVARRATSAGLGVPWVTVAAEGAAGAWAVAALLLLARLAWCHRHVRRSTRSARSAPREVVSCCDRLAGRIGVRPPAVLLSATVPAPALVGVRFPTILLPAHGAAGGATQGLEAVLLHELAHLKRQDVLWNWLGHVICALGFFQPLLWVLARRLEDASDLACDDYVVHFGGRRRSYALELFRWAMVSRGTWREAVAGAGVVRFRSSLGRRIVRILDDPLPRVLETARGVVLLLAVVTALCLGASASWGFRLAHAEGATAPLPASALAGPGAGHVLQTRAEPSSTSSPWPASASPVERPSVGAVEPAKAEAPPERRRAAGDEEAWDRGAESRRQPEPRREEGRAPERSWLSDDASHLYRQGQELRQRGQTDAGNGLVEQAERLERAAREEKVRREAAARAMQERGAAGAAEQPQRQRAPEFTSGQALELARQAEGLARDGKRAEAEELMARARQVEQAYRAREEPRERPESSRRE